MIGHNAVALRIRVHSMILSGSLAVNGHPKANRLAVCRRTEHKMQVAGMKMKDDLSAGGLEHGALKVIDPFARKSPLIEDG